MSLWPSPGRPRMADPRAGRHRTASRARACDGDRLQVTSRDALASTMCVLRDPGELFLLRHSLGPRGPDGPSSPGSSASTRSRSSRSHSSRGLGGPVLARWPGGARQRLAVRDPGPLVPPSLERPALLGSHKLPRPRPYNSLVVLACGALVMKDLDRRPNPTTLTVLDPETLEPLAPSRRRPSLRSRGSAPSTTPSMWSATTRSPAGTGTASGCAATRTGSCATAPAPTRATAGT